MNDAVQVFLYGLLAAASPTVLLATIAVLMSGRGRINGIVFLIAFLVGQSAAYLVAFLLGSTITPFDLFSGSVAGVVELAVGILLITFALQRRTSRRAYRPASTPRSQALFARLSEVRPALSFGIGLPLGIGAKRLMITLLAGSTVANAGLTQSESVSLSVLYIATASVVVWVPVIIYLFLGPRADGVMARARDWITAHEEGIMVGSALTLGLLLAADALADLL